MSWTDSFPDTPESIAQFKAFYDKLIKARALMKELNIVYEDITRYPGGTPDSLVPINDAYDLATKNKSLYLVSLDSPICLPPIQGSSYSLEGAKVMGEEMKLKEMDRVKSASNKAAVGYTIIEVDLGTLAHKEVYNSFGRRI